MNIDINSIPAMAAYLQTVNIVKLQYSARQSGYKFKNGPDSGKQAIIDGLSMRPSTMRATIAHLQRMERDPNSLKPKATIPQGQNPFALDLDEETQAPAPTPAPILQAPDSALDETVQRVLTAIGALSARVDDIQKGKTSFPDARAIAVEYTRPIDEKVTALQSGVEANKAAIIELQKRAPVQFIIDSVTLPPVTGQHFNFPRMAAWLGLKRHVLLVGPASSGKTTAAIAYAKNRGLELYSQPLSLSVFDVLGFVGPQGRVETEFSRAWQFGGVFLWDELSMSAKEAIGALNAALANGFASFPGLGTISKHENFIMIAGDNSDTGANLKYGARELLDGASLDRFIAIDWPIDEHIENALGASAPDWLACVRAIRAFIDKRDIQHVGATMRATIAGCEMIATEAFQTGKIPRRWVLEDTCKKGALRAEWQAVEALPEVCRFLQGV